MKKLIMTFAAVAMGTAAFAEATPSISGSTYTFTVASGTDTYSQSIPSGVNIVKEGAGTLTLSAATTAFNGTITVRAGILGASAPAAFGSPSAVTVENGGAFDLSTASGVDKAINKSSPLTIAGSGPDGKGAVRRLTGKYWSGNAFSHLTLTADATIDVTIAYRIGGTWTLNGHKLTKVGGADWVLNGVTVNPGSPAEGAASIQVDAGYVIFQGNTQLGGGAEKRLVWNTSGRLTFYDSTSTDLDWTIEAKKELFITQTHTVGGPKNAWYGPVVYSSGAVGAKIECGGSSTYVAMKGPSWQMSALNTWGGGGVAEITACVTNSGSVNVNGSILRFKDGRSQFGGNWVINNETRTDRAVGAEIVDADANFPAAKWVYFKANNLTYPSYLTISNSVWTFPSGSDGQLRLGSAQNGGNILRITGNSRVRSKLMLSHNANGSNGAGSRNMIVVDGNAAVTNLSGEIEIWGSRSSNYLELGGGTMSGYGFNPVAGPFAYHQKGGLFVGRAADSRVSKAPNGLFRMTGGTFKAMGGSFYTINGDSGDYTRAESWGRATDCSVVMSLEGADAEFWATKGVHLVHGALNGVDVTYNNVTKPSDLNAVLAVSDGAKLSVRRVSQSVASKASGSRFDIAFNGGVLRPLQSSDLFDTADHSKDPTSFTLYANGIVVDTADCLNSAETVHEASALYMPMTAPTGKGLASITLPGEVLNATTYYGPVHVKIRGSGHGAAAVAEFDSSTRRMTGVKVVAPGFGYDNGTTVEVESPDGSTVYPCAYTLADNATTGGLTKRGAPELILAGANTYGGATRCEQGKLTFNAANTYPGGDLELAGGEIHFNNAQTLTCTIRGTCADIFGGSTKVTCGGALDLSGATLVITDPENLDDYKDSPRVTLFTATSITGSPAISCGSKYAGRYCFVGDGTKRQLLRINGTMLLVR